MHIRNRMSIRAFAILASTGLLVSANASVAAAKPLDLPLIVVNNAQETTGADTGAKGLFTYRISGDRFCYVLAARGLSVPAAAAHIHIGARNTAGPVVIPLEVGSGTSWIELDCTTASEDLLEAVTENPRDYYVNVHTPTFPGGEIRGQLK